MACIHMKWTRGARSLFASSSLFSGTLYSLVTFVCPSFDVSDTLYLMICMM